jgi:uncharacterized protein YcbX
MAQAPRGTLIEMQVTRISITPVKGMALHHPDEVQLDRNGVAENRRFFMIDADNRLYGILRHVRIRAEVENDGDRLSLAFPDGEVVAGDVELGEATETDFWGRAVRGREVEGPWSEALSDYAGQTVRLVRTDRPGDAVDVLPATLVSRESVEALAGHAGRDAVDGRRFRMLLEIEGCEPHEEDGWAGKHVRVGEALLRVGGPVPRCAVTTRDPHSGERDLDTLGTIAGYRGLDEKRHANFGVYAEIEEPGIVRVGSPVEPV